MNGREETKDDLKHTMEAMQRGIDMQPSVPGYMLIPLALDAFHRGAFESSLGIAEDVIRQGDARGYSLAFAASLALGDVERARRYFNDPDAKLQDHPEDPMREVRVTFSNPPVLSLYEQVIAANWPQVGDPSR